MGGVFFFVFAAVKKSLPLISLTLAAVLCWQRKKKKNGGAALTYSLNPAKKEKKIQHAPKGTTAELHVRFIVASLATVIARSIVDPMGGNGP
jgi:hypothetical protein